jgi:hypothetical protein
MKRGVKHKVCSLHGGGMSEPEVLHVGTARGCGACFRPQWDPACRKALLKADKKRCCSTGRNGLACRYHASVHNRAPTTDGWHSTASVAAHIQNNAQKLQATVQYPQVQCSSTYLSHLVRGCILSRLILVGGGGT